MESDDLFSQDETLNQIACLADTFGLLNEVNIFSARSQFIHH
jgi:hypothetical protein